MVSRETPGGCDLLWQFLSERAGGIGFSYPTVAVGYVSA
jgi:hypothetical protein